MFPSIFQGAANNLDPSNDDDSTDDEEMATLVKNMSFPERLGAAKTTVKSISPSSNCSTDF